MDAQTILLEGVVIKAQDTAPAGGDVEVLRPYFRDQGMELKGFHSASLVVSVAPKALLLKKPLAVLKNVKWPTGRTGDVSYFPCKVTLQGMPLFGFIYIDHSATPNSQQINIIAPPMPILRAETRVLVELDSQRASVS